MDGDKNGKFTELLLKIWNNGQFRGNYRTFYQKIKGISPMTQTPNYYRTGQINPKFERQKPFTI